MIVHPDSVQMTGYLQYLELDFADSIALLEVSPSQSDCYSFRSHYVEVIVADSALEVDY